MPLASCCVGHRLVRRRWHFIGIAEAVLVAGVKQPGQLVQVDAQQAQVEVHLLQAAQLDGQQVMASVGLLGTLVVGDAIRLELLGRSTRL